MPGCIDGAVENGPLLLYCDDKQINISVGSFSVSSFAVSNTSPIIHAEQSDHWGEFSESFKGKEKYRVQLENRTIRVWKRGNAQITSEENIEVQNAREWDFLPNPYEE